MGTFLKQPKQRATKKRESEKQTPPQPEPDTSVAEAIRHFASIFSTWVTQERDGDNGSGLYSSPRAYPVRLQLINEDDIDLVDGIVGALDEQGGRQGAALERIATAFERIADAMTKNYQG